MLITPPRSSTMAVEPTKNVDKDQALDGWCCKIPRSGGGQPLSRKQLTEFYQTCHRLIQLHDAAITHRVINELASEGGLTRVAELVKLTELSLTYVSICAVPHLWYPAWASEITEDSATL